MESSDENRILDRNAVKNLLNPPASPLSLAGIIRTEEQSHPWRVISIPSHPTRSRSFEMPFLRIWDRCSASKPDDNNCMLSTAPRQRLDTTESRIDSLANHLDHKIWADTPFISFTISAVAVESLANMRATRHRGAQTLTVVDPNVRLAAGLPVLDVLAEMKHYDIADPYNNGGEYYHDHYACLWEVSAREIVGHWEWDGLAVHGNWYDEIVMPAFREFRDKHTPPGRVVTDELRDLLAGVGKLSSGFKVSGSFIGFVS
jgi:hypothetical protein